MSFGLDPLHFLALAPGDAQTVLAALQRAAERRAEYDSEMAKAIGARVAESVVPPLAKSIGSLVSRLAQAMNASRG